VDGHAFAKSGDLLGKLVGLQPRAPFLQYPDGCRVQALDLIILQITGKRNWRQAGAMQDLVGVGVADAREQARIGQGALEGMVLTQQPLPEFLK
jgi:hypothetical protein